ncbi:hypothetical protein [Chryseobacterium bernardetii]|nr:hypothetical protein [Chryseobacterium bernardetii]
MMKNDHERWILYPVAKGKEIIGIEVGILKNQETELEFWRMDSQDAYYKDIINLFRLAYNKKMLTEQAMGRGGNCGHTGEEPCDTGEVVITVPKPGGPKGAPNLYLPGANPGGGDPGVIGGGCGVYGNCDGGSNPDNPETSQNPCDKTKSLVNDAKTKPAIDALKAKSTQGGENGYKIKADGTPSNEIPGGDHSVNFGDKTGYAGGYHNHTPTGIPMLSPPDVDQLLGFARAQGNYGDPTKAFVGMVAPNGMHYVAWFNGSYNDALKTFSQTDLDAYVKIYKDTESDLTDESQNGMTYMNGDGSINNLGVEKLFFETLKNMGLAGKVNLQRIESSDSVKDFVKNISLDNKNQPTSTNCP